MPKKRYILFLALALLSVIFNFCTDQQRTAEKMNTADTLVYLNHSDSAKYVGMNTCKLCHQDIYNTFINTGMGQSFDRATRAKSAADFSNALVYDKITNLNYHAFWYKDSLYFKEYRLKKRDTLFQRTEQVNYIIGSGQHTNSHMQSINGYVNQMPMTFYTQKKHWDLPPGFENGVNTRFSRKIGLECISCHNGYPDFILGSENKFSTLPTGIDCERCHGPGSFHVAQRQSGTRVDTSKYIDYSIVNPAKLSIERQFDICQRCHLQGNAILKEGKSFYDFKPGQVLSNYISVFLPKYKNADEEFIMASHADRLKQSACFLKSMEKISSLQKNNLKPYKGAMTCVTCHNPHVSVRQTNKNVFNDACLKCHDQGSRQQAGDIRRLAVGSSSLQTAHRKLPTANWSNCVSCHMPLSGSTDIPHVSVHDHYIRKPISKTQQQKIKTFVGLFSINEKNPEPLTRARAYIAQYDKFEQSAHYLDSALSLLNAEKNLNRKCRALIQLYFIKQQFNQILNLVNELGEQNCFDKLFTSKTYDNNDAWAIYRVAEAFYYTGNKPKAQKWFKRATELAPYNLDFRNKLGSCLAEQNDLAGASREFEFIMNENPNYVAAYSNLGYIKMVSGFEAEAKRLYFIGEKLDPDNEALLLNLAAYYMVVNDKPTAKKYLDRILKKNPSNKKASMALTQLKS